MTQERVELVITAEQGDVEVMIEASSQAEAQVLLVFDAPAALPLESLRGLPGTPGNNTASTWTSADW